ncbi:MAG: hypothetical protein R2912_05775 [Eubacteriales bacterium]
MKQMAAHTAWLCWNRLTLRRSSDPSPPASSSSCVLLDIDDEKDATQVYIAVE